MNTINCLAMAAIMLSILIVFFISWRKKDKARNFVLHSESVLLDQLNYAQDLLDENPAVRRLFFNDLDELWGEYVSKFDGVDKNSIDVCWTTKEKEVMTLNKLVVSKIGEIEKNVQVLINAMIQVNLLDEHFEKP